MGVGGVLLYQGTSWKTQCDSLRFELKLTLDE